MYHSADNLSVLYHPNEVEGSEEEEEDEEEEGTFMSNLPIWFRF